MALILMVSPSRSSLGVEELIESHELGALKESIGALGVGDDGPGELAERTRRAGEKRLEEIGAVGVARFELLGEHDQLAREVAAPTNLREVDLCRAVVDDRVPPAERRREHLPVAQ